MQWHDSAIVISAQKYGESSAIATLLTKESGLFKGLVRGISSPKQRGLYQSGNFLSVKWSGRLPEHLGNFSAELSQANAAFLLQSNQKLSALNSICDIVATTLPEREPANNIYLQLYDFIELLQNNEHWPQYYILFEMSLLAHLGFGLDLSSCAATGVTDDLFYISPKSGRSLCKTAGEPYKNKLFKIPEFIKNGNLNHTSADDIKIGLDICSYFLEKYVFRPHNRSAPDSRARLVWI